LSYKAALLSIAKCDSLQHPVYNEFLILPFKCPTYLHGHPDASGFAPLFALAD
jgi:hypothetical protein